MQTLYLVFLLIGLSQSESGRPNEKCWRECVSTHYNAVVKCPKGVDNAETVCTCETNDVARSECELPPELKGPQSWNECHDFAMDNMDDNTLSNSFFRYETNGDGEETLCYLLPNCDQESSENCAPFDTAPCVAGTSRLKCEEDPTDSETLVCPRETWKEHGLHWTCIYNGVVINPYPASEDDESKLPSGTVCTVGTNGLGNHDCSTWIWSDEDDERKKEAQVKCGDDGSWAQVQQDVFLNRGEKDGDPILPDGTDALCNCIDLDLVGGTLDTDGLTLICDTVLTGDVIENGNACTLLCDFHMVMYIECYKGIWMRTDTYPFEEVTQDQIKC